MMQKPRKKVLDPDSEISSLEYETDLMSSSNLDDVLSPVAGPIPLSGVSSMRKSDAQSPISTFTTEPHSATMTEPYSGQHKGGKTISQTFRRGFLDSDFESDKLLRAFNNKRGELMMDDEDNIDVIKAGKSRERRDSQSLTKTDHRYSSKGGRNVSSDVDDDDEKKRKK